MFNFLPVMVSVTASVRIRRLWDDRRILGLRRTTIHNSPLHKVDRAPMTPYETRNAIGTTPNDSSPPPIELAFDRLETVVKSAIYPKM